jgi:hypothetical protein
MSVFIGFAAGSIIGGLVCAPLTSGVFMAAVGLVSAIDAVIGIFCFRRAEEDTLQPCSVFNGCLLGAAPPLAIVGLQELLHN